MSNQVSKAKALIDVATETFVDEILPEVKSEKRYTAAMTANALSIARRRLSHPDPGAALLRSLGVGTLDALASALRTGDTAGTPEKQLRQNLLTFIEGELAISNPRFLDQRTG